MDSGLVVNFYFLFTKAQCDINVISIPGVVGIHTYSYLFYSQSKHVKIDKNL